MGGKRQAAVRHRDNLLSPAGTATRAQVAQVLANFCQTVA